MAHFIHCCLLLLIVFLLAEIREVLTTGDPRQAAPLTIWTETPVQVAGTGSPANGPW